MVLDHKEPLARFGIFSPEKAEQKTPVFSAADGFGISCWDFMMSDTDTLHCRTPVKTRDETKGYLTTRSWSRAFIEQAHYHLSVHLAKIRAPAQYLINYLHCGGPTYSNLSCHIFIITQIYFTLLIITLVMPDLIGAALFVMSSLLLSGYCVLYTELTWLTLSIIGEGWQKHLYLYHMINPNNKHTNRRKHKLLGGG